MSDQERLKAALDEARSKWDEARYEFGEARRKRDDAYRKWGEAGDALDVFKEKEKRQ